MENYDGLRQMMHTVAREIISGGRHGFFECSLSCELVEGRKRRFRLKAGKVHQFIIQEKEFDNYCDPLTLAIRALEENMQVLKTAETAALMPERTDGDQGTG